MKTIILSFLLFTLNYNVLSAQESSYKDKVEKMLNLSGATQRYNMVIKNMIKIQKKSYAGLLTEDYFDALEEEILQTGLEKLLPKLLPIYEKYLTEEDIDGIIQFYESPVGKKLLEKTPMIVTEAMDVGSEWGTEIGLTVANRILESKEIKFSEILEDDCSRFKTGKFKLSIDSYDLLYMVERIDGIQIETSDSGKHTYTIEWISNNKYILTEIDTTEMDTSEKDFKKKIEVNIYEVTGNTYKFISKNGNFFYQGTCIKLE